MCLAGTALPSPVGRVRGAGGTHRVGSSHAASRPPLGADLPSHSIPTWPLTHPLPPSLTSSRLSPLLGWCCPPWRSADLVQVGEDEQAQFFAHIHGVHSKVVLELGDGDEAVDLGGGRTHA